MSDQELLDRAERTARGIALPDGRFDDLLRRRDRKRRNQRIAAGVVGLVVSMLVTAGLIRALESGRVPADRPIEPSPSTERVGFVGLPPEGAQPSTPPSGGLVIIFHGSGPDGVQVDLYVYADGTMIWQKWSYRSVPVGVPEGASEFTSGYLEQRLTTEGVELVRSRILSTRLFEHSLQVRSLIHDPYVTIGVLNGDRVVFVSAFQDGGPKTVAKETPAQARALARLDALLADPGERLPTTAWADREIRAYVASRYSGGFDRGVPSPSELPPQAAELLFGRDDCTPFTIEEVRTISKALEDAGIPASVNVDGQLAFEIGGTGPGGSYLHFWPDLPDRAAFEGWPEGRFPRC